MARDNDDVAYCMLHVARVCDTFAANNVWGLQSASSSLEFLELSWVLSENYGDKR